MDKFIDSIGSNLLFMVAVICYTIYEICALKSRPTKSERYEELKSLHELREKGVITEAEFNEKKGDLLSEI
jgi:hypothetical protein